jgi:hypothetical protein
MADGAGREVWICAKSSTLISTGLMMSAHGMASLTTSRQGPPCMATLPNGSKRNLGVVYDPLNASPVGQVV